MNRGKGDSERREKEDKRAGKGNSRRNRSGNRCVFFPSTKVKIKVFSYLNGSRIIYYLRTYLINTQYVSCVRR